MSKKNKGVLNEVAEALNKIADNLEELTTIAYVVATEAVTFREEFSSLKSTLEAKLNAPLPVVVDVETLSAALAKVSELQKPKGVTSEALKFAPARTKKE